MALTERSRSALYQGLTDLIEDEVAVGELLSYFPARDVEEPATKEFVAVTAAEVRADFSELRADFADLRAEFAGVGTEFAGLQSEFAGLRIEFAGLRTEFADLRADLRIELAAMESRLTAQAAAQMRTSVQWTLGALFSVMGLVLMGVLQGP